MTNIVSSVTKKTGQRAVLSKTALELLQYKRRQRRMRYKQVNGIETHKIGYPFMTLIQPTSLDDSYSRKQNQVKCKKENFPSEEDVLPFEIGLGVTEISGDAGSGKTQICLGLCVSCVMADFTNSSSESHPSTIFTACTENQNMAKTNVPPISIAMKTGESIQKKNLTDICSSQIKHRVQNPYLKTPSRNTFDNDKSTNSMFPKAQFYAIYVTLGNEGGTKTQLSSRLNQMIRSRLSSTTLHPTTALSTRKNAISSSPIFSNEKELSSLASKLLSRIWIRHMRNLDEFQEFINVELPAMLSSSIPHQQQQQQQQQQQRIDEKYKNDKIIFEQEPMKAGLIVFDSLAGLFRQFEDDDSNNAYMNRSGKLFRTASKLKWISETFEVPVITINQVTAKIKCKNHFGESISPSPNIPSLGLSWMNCVNTRYFLTREEKFVDEYFEKSSKHPQTANVSACTTSRFERRIDLLLSSCIFFKSNEFGGKPLQFRIDSTGAIQSN